MGLRSFFGFGDRRALVQTYLARNARIIDLRPKEALSQGTLPDAISITLEHLDSRIAEIRALAPVIVCCNNGFGSDEAVVLLRKAGIDAINGGSWRRLKKIIELS